MNRSDQTGESYLLKLANGILEALQEEIVIDDEDYLFK